MMKRTGYRIVAAGLIVACAVMAPLSAAAPGKKVKAPTKGKAPVKVFILAGQSNMEGQGLIEFNQRRADGYKKKGMSDEAIAKKRAGTLDNLAKNPAKASIYKHIVDKDGKWIVRKDVQVYYERGRGGMKKGELTVGFGARDDKIGPEFQFGHVMGDHFGEPVLLIKTAWGGKSLALNFRPPIAGKPGFEIKARRDGTTPKPGEYYRLMMTQAKEVLGNLKKHFPQYADRGYEIAGFCWHQGWNDGCNEDWAKEYAKNMPIFIRDLRKDLGVANLPFVIANSGFGGRKSHGGVVGRLQKMVQPAQTAAAKNAENVTCVDTRNFHRPEDKSPGRGDIEHWFSNAESYFLIGDAMGKAMKQMLGEPKMAPKKLAKPSKEDAEKFSYYLGHRNGKALAASPKQRPADNDAFLRGVRGSLGVEKTRASDKDNVDCKKGVKLGSQIALFAERRFPYLQLPKIVEGLGAGLTGKEPAYSTEVLKAAMIACSKFIKTPPTKKYIMLNKQAPKWDVGPWHQLPEGKTSLDISDFKGKVLYMYCFQSWCPGCHSRGFPALKQVSAKYKDDDSVKFVVFQTVFEDRASKPVNTFGNLKKIAQKYGLTMPFAQSGSREDKSKVMKAYKTRGTPWTMIIDKKGVIRYGGFHITPADAAKLIEKLKADKPAGK